MSQADRQIVGFTGTQKGMTAAQFHNVWAQLQTWAPGVSYGVHGACVGADDQFDQMLVALEIPRVIRPCTIAHMRVRCENRGTVLALFDPSPPLDRNRDIVYESDIVFVTPKTMEEELRSGTWATFRYARKLKRHTMIFWPDGSIEMSWRP